MRPQEALQETLREARASSCEDPLGIRKGFEHAREQIESLNGFLEGTTAKTHGFREERGSSGYIQDFRGRVMGSRAPFEPWQPIIGYRGAKRTKRARS